MANIIFSQTYPLLKGSFLKKFVFVFAEVTDLHTNDVTVCKMFSLNAIYKVTWVKLSRLVSE